MLATWSLYELKSVHLIESRQKSDLLATFRKRFFRLEIYWNKTMSWLFLDIAKLA